MSHRLTGDPDNPIGVGRCAKSNFMVPRNELVKQMEWRGDSLVWTGHWVWNKFADKPNPQLRRDNLKPDPETVFPALPDHADDGDDWLLVAGDSVQIANADSMDFLKVDTETYGIDIVLLWK